MFRILSFDGGGIRGAFGIGLVQGLEERLGRPITDYFDLLAGTSTGAITAACLAHGRAAADVQQFYDDNADLIFKPRPERQPAMWLRPVYPLVRKVFHSRTGGNFDDLFRSRYCPMALEMAFRDGFGNATMSDLRAARLIVPAVNLSKGKTVVFRTPHLRDTIDQVAAQGDVEVVDVLLATTAAPTYFPHHALPDGDAYCDGGVWAVNPSLLALAEGIKMRAEGIVPPPPPGVGEFGCFRVLSVGAGQPTYTLDPPGADAGALYWSRRIADVMGTSQVQGLRDPMDFTLGDRFRAINFEIPHREWSLDGVAHRQQMYGLGLLRAREVFDELAPVFFEHPKDLPQDKLKDACNDATTAELADASASP